MTKAAFKSILLTLVSVSLISTAAHGQQDRGAVAITGTIRPALSLALAGQIVTASAGDDILESRPDALVQTTRLNSFTIRLNGTGAEENGQIRIPFAIRTNIGYELKVTMISSQGCIPNISAFVGALRTSGRATMAGAADRARPALASSFNNYSETSVLAGPRVSARGNFSSSENALLSELVIDLGKSSGCGWQASLLVTLESSTN